MRAPLDNQFSPEQWLPQTASQELDKIYETTLQERFKSFSIIPYEEVVKQYAEPYPLTPYRSDKSVPDWLLESIVNRDSFDKYQETLGNTIVDFGLDDWLEHNGSLAVVTDHGQFTDVPVTAEVIGRIGVTERARTLQVISRMISKMSLQFVEGFEVNVQEELSGISSLISTIPRIDGNPSDKLNRFREEQNNFATETIARALKDNGTVLVESFIGRHNTPSKSGKTLYIHEPNRRTAELLAKPNIKVLPIYIHCPTFQKDGTFGPADMRFKIFEPTTIKDADKATDQITFLFKEATQEAIGHQYKHGVKVRKWKNQERRNKRKNLIKLISGDDTVTSDY